MNEHPAAILVNGSPLKWDAVSGDRFRGRVGDLGAEVRRLYGNCWTAKATTAGEVAFVVHAATSPEEAASKLGELMG